MARNRPSKRLDASRASPLNRRKLQHLEACLDETVDLQRDSFAPFKLRYQALPEVSLDEVSTEGEFAGNKIAAPLIISSMTGGVGKEFCDINRNLARGAEALNIPLGLGSMKVMLSHEDAQVSFQVRNVAPSVKIIANLGLVSFNYGMSYEDMEWIIETVHPDVFGLHLNALQESIQEGGDTNFAGLLHCLEKIIHRCPLPIYVKECGGGIAPQLVYRLANMGVDYVDISGSDGTSWSAVEGRFSRDPSLGELLKDFGLPTAWILENLRLEKAGKVKIIASGGIRNGIQGVKALALGAHYVSVARPFLLAALDSAEAVVEAGRRIIREMHTAMFLVGVSRVEQLNRSLLIHTP
ncbi:type 2 isopentenyl-diphosphate Delta-isomerase [Acidobacteria bacterium AH-259-O06]|nr:type 2 isopentenyl-diphosphate Delta-isomerase [Acidobacteria bacterium AH-259-O06]